MRTRSACVRAAVCLLLVATALASGEVWSWGVDPTPAAPSSGKALSDHSQVPLPLPLEPHPPQSAPSENHAHGDQQARFLGLHKTLCSLGISFHCKKKTRPGSHNNIPGSSYPSVPGQGFSSSFRPFLGAPRPTPGHRPSSPDVTPIVVDHHHSHTHVHHGHGVEGHPHNSPDFHPSSGQGAPHQFSVYHEPCQCVHASYCPSYDVVARNNPGDIVDLVDVRSRGSDILSEATDVDETVTTTASGGDTATPHTGRQAKIVDVTKVKEETRVRRDTLGHTDAALNATHNTQARTFLYYPGAAGCGAAYVCCRNPQATSQYSCGRRHTSGAVPRIKTPQYVKGDTQFGEYPWHVAILKYDDEYVCGGVLIDDRHVLTAAHCVDGLIPHELKVRLGEWDVHGPTEFYSHVEMTVEFVAVHPRYYAGNLHNDIAAIRMHRYVDLPSNPHISPVCLPDSHSSFVGQRCHSTGWGKDAFGSQGEYQSVLQEVELPVVDHYQCQQALRHTRLGPNFNLQQGMLCAGGEEGRDTCKGDGGGPLVCSGPEGRFQLAGLVSWGVGCGLPGVPGVYVDVAYYLQWLYEVGVTTVH